jgi:hypothetical protein
MNNRDDYELEEGINLFIKEKSDATNKSESDNNDIKRQISENIQIFIDSTRSTRNRQFSIRYR